MDNNEAYLKFKEWFAESYPFNYKGHRYEEAEANAWEGWQAAQQQTTHIDAVKFQEALDAMCVDKDKEIAELKAAQQQSASEIAESDFVIKQTTTLLAEICLILKGEPPAKTLYGYQDLPKMVVELKQREQKLIANFHINMIKAYPTKSHDEIAKHINEVLGGEVNNDYIELKADNERLREALSDTNTRFNEMVDVFYKGATAKDRAVIANNYELLSATTQSLQAHDEVKG